MESSNWSYRVGISQRGVVHEIRFGGGPLEDAATAQPLLFALGRLAATWGRLEQQIDTIILQINKRHHSSEVRALFDPEHPVSFRKKIQLLKKYFNQHPALASHKA